MPENLKEKIARALADSETNWLSETGEPDSYMAGAQAALNVIEQAGYVIVPREPTDRMIWAGGAALHDRDEDADGVWTAMITVDPAL